MRFLITHTFSVRSLADELLPAPDLHGEGERLMGALLDLERCNDDVSDAATSTDVDRGVVAVDLLVAAHTPQAALDLFLTVVRTAIHSIGGVTDDWPGAPDTTAGRHEVAGYAPLDVTVEYV